MVAPQLGNAAPLAVKIANGVPHVTAAALEADAGIAIKRLPGPGGYVACGVERCAPLAAVTASADGVLVPVPALETALDLSAHFDDDRRFVTLVHGRRHGSSPASGARVGSLAPNLRLRKLDGTPVALDQFRGQRVLINSWASW